MRGRTTRLAPAVTPYCNPAVFNGVDGNGMQVDIGVCSESRRGVGSLCGSTDPDEIGLTTGCDTSSVTPDNTLCIPGQANLIGANLPANLGICGSICNDDVNGVGPCNGIDPVRGPLTCSDTFLTFQGESIGLCGTGCSNFPEDCGGDGELGAGRFCGPAAAAGAQFCWDIVPPTLAPGEIVNGIRNEQVGDNCLAANTTNQLSCPPGSLCISNPNGTRGWCYYGCSRAPNSDPQVCNDFLNTTTSTCAFVLNTMLPIGLCSEVQ